MSDGPVDVSVILVSYNTAHLLAPCLDRLEAASQGLAVQVIVVDNDSRDGSLQVLRERHGRHEIIGNSVNVGFARANNQVLDRVRGRHVLLLNTDAFVEPDALRSTVAYMDANPGCGVLGVRLTGRDGELQPSCRYFPTPWNVFLQRTGLDRFAPGTRLIDDMRWPHDSVRSCDWVPGCFYLVRTEVVSRGRPVRSALLRLLRGGRSLSTRQGGRLGRRLLSPHDGRAPRRREREIGGRARRRAAALRTADRERAALRPQAPRRGRRLGRTGTGHDRRRLRRAQGDAAHALRRERHLDARRCRQAERESDARISFVPKLAGADSLLARTAMLLAAGAALGLIGSALRPGGLRLFSEPRAASCEAPAFTPTLLSPADAAHICATSGALIADARTAGEFAAGHVASAIHLPCNAAGELAGAALAHLADRSLVLVYGRDTQEALDVATSIARRLPAGAGPRIYALQGGFAAWETAGLACASGPCDELAAGIANGNPACLSVWRSITQASRFFSANKDWAVDPPDAVLGIFSGFSQLAEKEVLNLINRSGQQYRLLLKAASPPELSGLRAVVCPDKEPPSAQDRAAIGRFVSEGGMLITGPEWGPVSDDARKPQDHPRFSLFTVGKGTIALSKTPIKDPYLLANDTAILLSHRYDLLRFFNGGALMAYRSRNLAQVLFYATQPPVDATVWIAGSYHHAEILTLDQPDPVQLSTQTPHQGGIEVLLPPRLRYAAIKLFTGN